MNDDFLHPRRFPREAEDTAQQQRHRDRREASERIWCSPPRPPNDHYRRRIPRAASHKPGSDVAADRS